MPQKGFAPIIIIILILAIIGGLIWFVLSNKDSKVSTEERMAVVLKSKSFQDVSSGDENYAAVEYLFREGILDRDESKLFNSTIVVSRFEWVHMLVKLTGVTPDEDIYKNCFSDVGKGKNEAVICFAKEQEWLEGFVALGQLNYWEFVQTARAQQTEVTFNPDNPVKKDEAIGSLSRLMDWRTDKAVDFAKERKIIEGDSKGDLTKGDAANIIYRSVATVPLKNDTYSKKLDNVVERYKLDELIDLEEKLERQRKEEASYWRRERAKKYAEMFGERAAVEIVAEAEKFDDVFEAQEAESKAYLKKAREKKYEQMLAEDKALGKEAPEYNILEPLQKVFAAKGGAISMDDLVIHKRTPPHYDKEEKINNPVIKSRDGATIWIFLDENYGVISPSSLAKGKYALSIGVSSFYQDGRTIGHVGITLRNFITGVGEKVALTRRFNLNNLDKVLQGSFNDLEADIGQMVTSPIIASPPPKTPTPNENQNSQSKENTARNDYSDGYFEFLDIATGQPSIAFSTAQKPHIIIAADPGVDVRNWLPIRIEIKKDGSNFWNGKIDGDTKQICRGPTGCSTNGPSGIGLDWKKIEIVAFDKNGKVVATFFETYNPSN